MGRAFLNLNWCSCDFSQLTVVSGENFLCVRIILLIWRFSFSRCIQKAAASCWLIPSLQWSVFPDTLDLSKWHAFGLPEVYSWLSNWPQFMLSVAFLDSLVTALSVSQGNLTSSPIQYHKRESLKAPSWESRQRWSCVHFRWPWGCVLSSRAIPPCSFPGGLCLSGGLCQE